MIDINKVKEFYKEYISKYTPEQPRIALKVAHIYRTAEKAKWLAEKLELSTEDVLLAELIGLLHDIGRFEQVKKYNTFIDSISINHGEFGVKVLFEDNLIRNFIEDNTYDEIIKKSILNHNRSRIEEGCTNRELMHCKIIRDADKLDIFYVTLKEKLETTFPLDRLPKEGITKEVIDEFNNNYKIDYSKINTCADLIVGRMAYVFDINYLYSLEEINNEKYLDKVIEKYNAKDEETKKTLMGIKEFAEKYMKAKIEEGKICLRNY